MWTYLGQSVDFSALSVVERRRWEHGWREREEYEVPPALPLVSYAVRHLQRWPLDTPYPGIVTDVKGLLERQELERIPCTLIIDRTGVGAAVADLFTAARLRVPVIAVTIHGGDVVTRDGHLYRVPKRDLIGVVTVLLQNRQLDIVPTLPDAEILTQELLSFRVKQDPLTGHDSYGEWRTGHHDDLVLATALALWYAQRGGLSPVLTEVEGLW